MRHLASAPMCVRHGCDDEICDNEAKGHYSNRQVRDMNSTENEGRRPAKSQDVAAPAPENAAPPATSEQRSSQVDNRTVGDLVKILKLLADPTRLQILLMLTEQGDTHVRAICDALGQNQPAVSHHLALLRAAGLIEARRDGKHNFYRIDHNRIRERFDEIFADTPKDQRSIRFADYVLRYHPAQPSGPAAHATRTDSSCQQTPPQR